MANNLSFTGCAWVPSNSKKFTSKGLAKFSGNKLYLRTKRQRQSPRARTFGRMCEVLTKLILGLSG